MSAHQPLTQLGNLSTLSNVTQFLLMHSHLILTHVHQPNDDVRRFTVPTNMTQLSNSKKVSGRFYY